MYYNKMIDGSLYYKSYITNEWCPYGTEELSEILVKNNLVENLITDDQDTDTTKANEL
jgi:hypothetical protein